MNPVFIRLTSSQGRDALLVNMSRVSRVVDLGNARELVIHYGDLRDGTRVLETLDQIELKIREATR